MAHIITIGATHQRVGAGYRASHPHGTTAPGHRTFVAAPTRTTHHIITVAKRRDAAIAHLITICATNQRVGA